MPATALLGFPYPLGTDDPDVPADIQALAARLEAIYTGASDPGNNLNFAREITAASGNSGQVRIGNYGSSFPAITFGLGAGADTNLYRAAPNVLKTDDDFASALSIVANAGGANQVQVGSANALIYFGNAYDTNLYRSAANTLKTDDQFAASLDIYSRLGAASQVLIGDWGGNAAILFGSGFDTNLYRASAGVVKTDNALQVGGNAYITWTGSTWAFQALASGDTWAASDIYARQSAASQIAIGARGPAAEAAIAFGSAQDIKLYRKNSFTLTTTQRIGMEGSAGSVFLQGTVTGEAQPRFNQKIDGTTMYGPGGAVLPGGPSPGVRTNYDATADALKCQGKFMLSGFGVPGSGGLAVDVASGAGATATGPVGTVVAKLQIFNNVGAALGWMPIYNTIT
jgi:hypothetical protein